MQSAVEAGVRRRKNMCKWGENWINRVNDPVCTLETCHPATKCEGWSAKPQNFISFPPTQQCVIYISPLAKFLISSTELFWDIWPALFPPAAWQHSDSVSARKTVNPHYQHHRGMWSFLFRDCLTYPGSPVYLHHLSRSRCVHSTFFYHAQFILTAKICELHL